MTQRLKHYYYEIIVPKLMALPELSYISSYQVPSIQKIVVNRGIGGASQNNKILESSL